MALPESNDLFSQDLDLEEPDNQDFDLTGVLITETTGVIFQKLAYKKPRKTISVPEKQKQKRILIPVTPASRRCQIHVTRPAEETKTSQTFSQ